MPRHPLDRTRAHLFKKLMDEYIHPACIVFTFATANRGPLASLSKEQRDAQLAKAPLQRQSEYKRAAVEEGLGSPMGKEATKSFEKLLKWVQESTERGPWLAGADYSLADIAATPYMVRLEMLKLSRMWDKKPGVAEWWERVKARPSYETAISEMAAAGRHRALRENRRPLGQRQRESRGRGSKTSMRLVGNVIAIGAPLRGDWLSFGPMIIPEYRDYNRVSISAEGL